MILPSEKGLTPYERERREERKFVTNFPLKTFRMPICLDNCECQQCRRKKKLLDEANKGS